MTNLKVLSVLSIFMFLRAEACFDFELVYTILHTLYIYFTFSLECQNIN